MNPCDIIRKKRFGEELNEVEIRAFVDGIVDGSFADYQASALLMAICINGMTDRETLALTLAMAKSGDTLDLSDIPGVKADKHSTGGVGDTTSLILVPLVAACGVKMAKMSGRGLGFTGGTLDKLESIPGMSIAKDIADFKQQVKDIGCAIIGQTAELAPADKVLYALRDVTATVDCLPLIVSSILSKKLAAGCDVVVLDVKSGSGALMDTPEKSRQLAEMMVRIGDLSGKRFSALITDMDQPLGNYIGNALEVEEAIDVLAGRTEGELKTVALTLGAHILRNAGATPDVDAGIAMLEAKIASGEGLKLFGDMIEAQGGDRRVVEDTGLLPKAPYKVELKADKGGYVTKMHTSDIGNAAKLLGAGRERKTDVLDLSVGIVMNVRLGDAVKKGDTLATLHVGEKSDKVGAYNLLKKSIVIGDEKPELKPLIQAVVE
jgi:pyrimidine-nucleoside phosphorylase